GASAYSATRHSPNRSSGYWPAPSNKGEQPCATLSAVTASPVTSSKHCKFTVVAVNPAVCVVEYSRRHAWVSAAPSFAATASAERQAWRARRIRHGQSLISASCHKNRRVVRKVTDSCYIFSNQASTAVAKRPCRSVAHRIPYLCRSEEHTS